MEPTRIDSVEGLDALLEGSRERPLILLKHSTRCPVSSWAHAEFMRFIDGVAEEDARVAIVYVVEDRPVSDTVAERLGVAHESPQALVVVDGKVAWHDSHNGITEKALQAALDQGTA